MDEKRLTGDEITAMGLDDWRAMLQGLQARFLTGRFDVGLQMVNQIGAAAEEMNHHPDLDLRYTHLNVLLMSHDVNARTQRDVDLARRISQIAADLGVRSDPAAVQRLEIAIDTWDAAEIKPFWRAVLGMQDNPKFDDDLLDPRGDLPGLWFQQTDKHDEPRQRFHLDITVPPEVAADRIAAAVAAGGVVVDREVEPRFVVLADAQGNKVCVCTQVGRGA